MVCGLFRFKVCMYADKAYMLFTAFHHVLIYLYSPWTSNAIARVKQSMRWTPRVPVERPVSIFTRQFVLGSEGSNDVARRVGTAGKLRP